MKLIMPPKEEEVKVIPEDKITLFSKDQPVSGEYSYRLNYSDLVDQTISNYLRTNGYLK